MILADKIIENRKRNGWSQEELAEKLGVSRQSVSKWEGAQAIPDMKKILQMASLFGVTTDYLLKDELDQSETVDSEEYIEREDASVRVSLEDASSFLDYNERAAVLISTGVMLCILSPVLLIVLPGFASLGRLGGPLGISEYAATMLSIIVLLLMVACGVGIFIVMGIKGNAFSFLDSKAIDTEYGVSGMAKDRRDAYAPTHIKLLVIGIGLCVISAIPLFVIMMTGYSSAKLEGLLVPVGVGSLISMIAVGVKLIVLTSIRQDGFNKLLEEGDYSRINKRASQWDGIYWAIATAVYLTWSFITTSWATTWIVWPIAGVIFGAYKEIVKAVLAASTR